jgi:hypothetical protein
MARQSATDLESYTTASDAPSTSTMDVLLTRILLMVRPPDTLQLAVAVFLDMLSMKITEPAPVPHTYAWICAVGQFTCGPQSA